MKIYKMFVAAMTAVILFASCSKENGGPKGGTDNAAMLVKLSYGDNASTYAVDSPVNAGSNTTLSTAILFEMVGTNVLQSRELSSTDIAAMVSATGHQIENVNTTVDGVCILGNAPSADKMTLLSLTTKAAIEAFAFKVADQQTTASNNGVTKITVLGFGSATSMTNPTGDGHDYKEASVTATPLVARMEIMGQVQNSTAPENQIQSITWKEVYFNRWYTTSKMDAMQNYGPTDPAWGASYPSWAKDAYNVVTEGTTKCYAYQFFPATATDAELLPMIVMKADVTLKDGRTLSDYYITIKTYKNGATDLTKMVVNKIYKVNLNNLTVDHTDFTPTPNPATVDLGIKVTITPWTVENITPII